MSIDYRTGDVLDVIAGLPDNSIDFVATSPPFLKMRNYNDLDGQWGSEPTPAAFLDNLLTLTVELRRVLTPTGSIAIELGDTYSGSGGGGGDYGADGLRAGQNGFVGSSRRDREQVPRQNNGGPAWPLSKSLTGIPTLYAWSLAYGRNLLNPGHEIEPWRVRNVIVWARNNPPVGALGDKVRPATSYITVACPSGKRWFDLDAVRGPLTQRAERERSLGGVTGGESYQGEASDWGGYSGTHLRRPADGGGAPPLDHWHDEYDGDLTWLVNTAGSGLSHFAMWPARLAERLVLSMCPAEVCVVCQEPRRRITGPAEYVPSATYRGGSHSAMTDGDRVADKANQYRHNGEANASVVRSAPTLGWSDCGHGSFRPGRVLDPFAGTGTTLAVAELHGRDSIGIDLDPTNAGLVPRRMAEVKRALFGFKDENVDGQAALW